MPARKLEPVTEETQRRPLNGHLLEIIKSFRSTFVSVFVFSFFLNLLTLAVPLYLLQIYSKVLPSGNIDTLVFLTGIAIAAILTLGALEAIRRAILAKAGARFEHALGEHILDSAIHRAIVKSYPSVNALRELGKLREFIAGSTILPLFDLPWSPLFILVLFILHPMLGLIGVVGALVLLSLALLNERTTREPQRKASQSSRELLENTRAWIGNADVIEAMGLASNLRKRYRQQGAEATLAQHHAGRINTRFSSASKLVRLFLQITMIAVAAWYIVKGELTAGATIASILLIRRAVAPLEQSIRSWKSVLSAREGLRVVSEYLDHAVSLSPASVPPTPNGALMATNLSYRRNGERHSVFRRVELELLPGTLTALVGPTAAGKSTLLRVLAGILSPIQGKVSLGGLDLSLWRAEQRGPHIGYLPQDVSLFPVSIKENIARLTDAPLDAVVDAAVRAHAHESIQALPASYDTTVDPEGRNLSGGQRQRIGYARALFGSPSVVLLDEPDANLDAAGRSDLRKSLRKLRSSGVAILIITHRESLESMADRVYKLEDGKLKLIRSDDYQSEHTRSASSLREISKPLTMQVSSNESDMQIQDQHTAPEIVKVVPMVRSDSRSLAVTHVNEKKGHGNSQIALHSDEKHDANGEKPSEQIGEQARQILQAGTSEKSGESQNLHRRMARKRALYNSSYRRRNQ